MNAVALLDSLCEFTKEKVKDIQMPTKPQKDTPSKERAPEVYKMRLPNSRSAKDVAPYIIHQIITLNGNRVTVRSIFAVYSDDEQLGGIRLLNLMERLRIAFLEEAVIGGYFVLDTEPNSKSDAATKEAIEYIVYPDDTAPFFAGEMATTWIIPNIERKVDFYG